MAHGPDAYALGPSVVREPEALYTDGAAPGGYRKRRPQDYDRGLCLLPSDVVDFLLGTQPKGWERRQHYGAQR